MLLMLLGWAIERAIDTDAGAVAIWNSWYYEDDNDKRRTLLAFAQEEE